MSSRVVLNRRGSVRDYDVSKSGVVVWKSLEAHPLPYRTDLSAPDYSRLSRSVAFVRWPDPLDWRKGVGVGV